MKNDKNYNYRRQNIEISRRNQRTSNFTSPKKNEVSKVNETSEKTENLTGNNLLENTLKYLEMSNNGNNNYILDNNNNYIIPGLNEEYDITKKYTDSYHNNSLNYGYYTENNIKNENENGNEKWKVIHIGKVLNKSDIEILSDYNAKVRGLFNYYCIADNAYVIGKFGRTMKYSMMKTFACKYKTKVSKIKKKYTVDGDFSVSYETKQGIRTSVFYNQGYGKREKAISGQIEVLPQYKRYDRPDSIARKLKSKTCELCGCYCAELEIHQVKKLKNLKGNTDWEKLMLKRRRKTLAVCPDCHKIIHSCD